MVSEFQGGEIFFLVEGLREKVYSYQEIFKWLYLKALADVSRYYCKPTQMDQPRRQAPQGLSEYSKACDSINYMTVG